jgi:hypothetical protein
MTIGAALVILGSLSIFIASNLRYLMDLVPLLTIISALCLWWGLSFFEKLPPWRNALLTGLVLLGVVTITFGLLAGLAEYPYRFQTINPQLYSALSRFFSGK